MLSFHSVWVSLVLLAAQNALCAPFDSTSPSATIDSGVVIGLQTSLPGSVLPINKFLGIPYAAPPVRFSPAVKPTPWNTSYYATQLGPSCIQVWKQNRLVCEW
jgi:hypothetical protein